MNDNINVIGAGLAGCECAYQIAKRGIKVNLFDMKPHKFSPAHKNNNLCELVCSNSFKAQKTDSAAGLLKEELRVLDSLILKCADKTSVPAGGALAVDREKFSELVTKEILNHPLINFKTQEITDIDYDDINIIATGPLTSDALANKISDLCEGFLSFFDAAAPIVTFESIDMDFAFWGSRYGKGDASSYLNCPLDEETYKFFYNELIGAQRAPVHGFDVLNPKVYEGCMPVEVAALRGIDTLRYGPMKPVGLKNPKEGKRSYAVVQLRRENKEGTLYNMVGFQTNLKFSEQTRVFGIVPALKNLEIVRYGVMHRNTFINSPKLLYPTYQFKTNQKLFFAGQITGTEGYIESVSSGFIAGINATKIFQNKSAVVFPKETVMGALANYISDENIKNFQPMGANLGILPNFEPEIKNKQLRHESFAKRSLSIIKT
ncbi:MAG: methylenetetrahydrofolate--tRNA-(uracil(54)-C(5))-methyltransferase (FADH(2)-oxidizing) TrmFO [Oscillospiraceae bacterium]|jgi:methylenetetrahydrofolate--tRNA-(uracil-5-)-methyltransferase|nr:methylenetetrahydrofolate--tRNA-(uracil(54)-C(5))-methyltransferase (FADH(2)-oxidizing) TrmFO [Oscillospiraceae bacterium]